MLPMSGHPFGLRRITRIACGMTQAHGAASDRLLDRTHDQSLAQFGNASVVEFDDFSVVVAGIDMPNGNGNLPEWKAFSAMRSDTTESLPPQNSSAGLPHSAATSRMMWIVSDSSQSRW